MSDEGLKNYPVEVNGVTNASTIFGPNLDRLKGASNRQTQKKGEGGISEDPQRFLSAAEICNLGCGFYVHTVFYLW